LDGVEQSNLKEMHSDACQVEKRCATAKNSGDSEQRKSLQRMLDEINEYLDKRRGKYERIAETVLKHINCKHPAAGRSPVQTGLVDHGLAPLLRLHTNSNPKG
jgi:uncharacterized protein YyaL (SSP411 family)